MLLGARGDEERRFYIGQAIEQGWSRAALVHQIEADLFRRQGRAATNFKAPCLCRPECDRAADG